MTLDEVEKIKKVLKDKDYVIQLLNAVGKSMIEAFKNLKIEDVNMYKLGYNKAIDNYEDKLLYQIGDLGIRDIIQETAEQLKENNKK